MSRMGTAYIKSLNREREPIGDDYLRECECRARRFQGAWTGTNGDLAARLFLCVQEIYRLKVELARLQNM